MTYENPQVDHSVNVSSESEGRGFIRMILWSIVGIVGFVVLLIVSMRALAPWIPMEWETALSQHLFDDLASTTSDPDCPREAWLNSLALRLGPSMAFPDDMPLHVHWVDDDIENAFATLGGHIFIHQGVIDRVDSENALAMIVAHEMAHILHRDPIASAGSGIIIAVVLQSIGIRMDQLVNLSQVQFTRHSEAKADNTAMNALEAHYGHLNGADAFFATMLKEETTLDQKMPQFLLTHPHLRERTRKIERRRQEQGNHTPPIPLPAFMHTCP